jgi:hypothetical protein
MLNAVLWQSNCGVWRNSLIAATVGKHLPKRPVDFWVLTAIWPEANIVSSLVSTQRFRGK